MVAQPWLKQGTCRLWGQGNRTYLRCKLMKSKQKIPDKMGLKNRPKLFRTCQVRFLVRTGLSSRKSKEILNRTLNFYWTFSVNLQKRGGGVAENVKSWKAARTGCEHKTPIRIEDRVEWLRHEADCHSNLVGLTQIYKADVRLTRFCPKIR